MGYYIETNSARNKASWILKNCPGSKAVISGPVKGTKDEIPVVVMNNGPFEAAGIAFSPEELEEFSHPTDPRPKQFLLVPRAEVVKLCPSVEGELCW